MSGPGDPSGDAVTSGVGDAVTLGVEEEFQLLDVETGHVVSRAPSVLAALPAATPPEWVQGELTQSQVEIATPVCRSLDELRAHLEHWRRVTSQAAAQAGCVLAASGTPPAGDWREQRLTRSQRYLPLCDGMRHLVDEQLIAGCHVHIGVSSPDLRVAVLDRLRAWMPVLIALTANSPLWLGVDTGFASWRTVHWWRWPVSGPPPAFGTAHDYDQRVAALTADRNTSPTTGSTTARSPVASSSGRHRSMTAETASRAGIGRPVTGSTSRSVNPSRAAR
ncbi:MAG: carboxylate-amine ligase [Frankiaceae bacterium]